MLSLIFIHIVILFSFILRYLCVCLFLTITNPLITTNKAETQCKLKMDCAVLTDELIKTGVFTHSELQCLEMCAFYSLFVSF